MAKATATATATNTNAVKDAAEKSEPCSACQRGRKQDAGASKRGRLVSITIKIKIIIVITIIIEIIILTILTIIMITTSLEMIAPRTTITVEKL